MHKVSCDLFLFIASYDPFKKNTTSTDGHCMKAQEKRFINTSGISGYHDGGFQ